MALIEYTNALVDQLKAVSLDIGAGTVDFLLYDDNKHIENCTKMVLPSPQKFFAEKIRENTRIGLPVFLNGYTIGGGSLTGAIKIHIEKGHSAHMTSEAAYSIRNDLTEVKEMGVKIVDKKPMDFYRNSIFLDEIRLNTYESTLNSFSETIQDVDAVTISVKDHGAPPKGVSNRVFRIKKFKEILSENNDLNSFLFHEKQIPEYYYRMKSAVRASKAHLPDVDVYLMDTSISSLVGCLWDHRVHGRDHVLAVNIGNGHTIATVVSKNKVQGFFEHHTGRLTGDKLVRLMRKLCDGTLTHEEVFSDGGHGAAFFGDMPNFSMIDVIAVTGPRRDLLGGSGIKYLQATPGGDVMMTGTIGLIRSLQTNLCAHQK
jgi:uncharacterized protein (DUF1786 family)